MKKIIQNIGPSTVPVIKKISQKESIFLCPYQINSEQDIPLFVTQALGADSCTYKWQKLNKYHPRLRTTVSYQFLSGAGQDVVGEGVGVLQSVPTLGYR